MRNRPPRLASSQGRFPVTMREDMNHDPKYAGLVKSLTAGLYQRQKEVGDVPV